jgi:hypothetical protein
VPKNPLNQLEAVHFSRWVAIFTFLGVWAKIAMQPVAAFRECDEIGDRSTGAAGIALGEQIGLLVLITREAD